MRLVDVFLDDYGRVLLYIIRISRQEYTSTLTVILRLNYKSSRMLLTINFLHKIFIIMRHHISVREEIKFSWYQFMHSSKMTTKSVLSCNLEHARKVVDTLMVMHFFKKLHFRSSIEPSNVPIGFLFLSQVVFHEGLASILNRGIMRLAVDCNSWRLPLS